MTIILFFAVLFVLILVHEWGHFIAAKKTDMRVDEFGIGFPPKLFGVKKGETEYTFNLLPIGGFVRILGENSESSEFSPVESEAIDRRSEALNAEAGEGGTKSNGHSAPIHHPRSFAAKSKTAQAVVLIAGVTMNIIFAWFLFVLAFMVGVPTTVDETTASSEANLMITGVLPDSPADESEIVTGSKIVGVESEGIELTDLTPTAFSQFASEREGVDIDVSYQLEGETEVVTVVPEINSEEGKVLVGVRLAMIENVSRPIHVAVYDATLTTFASLWAITAGLSGLIADSITGSADFSQVAGPIGIANLVGDAAQFGLTSLLMFTAIISLNLAVINMLPFPALDGGRLLFVGIEAISQKPIKPVWVSRLNMIGFVLLMLLMVAVTYNDILRIL